MPRSPIARHLLLLTAAALGGCAQGVWIRPGTSAAEANATMMRCDYEASMATPPSQIHMDGRQTLGKSVATGILQGIDEGIRAGLLKRKCMAANGFQLVPREAAQAMASAAAPLLPPAPDAAAAALPVAQLPPTVPAAPGAVLAVKALPAVPAPPPAAVANPPTLVAARFTTPITLPARASETSFLLGACSAGDQSACIAIGASRPTSRNPF